MNVHHYTRRAFLRGIGVSMALPWMESRTVWGDEPTARPASEAPVRLAVLFSGNGFHSKEWWAKGEGKSMELGKVLAPLSDFREKMLFVRGLLQRRGAERKYPQFANRQFALRRADGLGGRNPLRHELRPARWRKLTDARPKCPAWCSAASGRIRRSTRIYSMLYSSHISWSSPTTPTPLELYPALAFDRLFKDEARQGTKACSTPCSPMHRTCAAISAPATSANSTNISNPSAMSNNALRAAGKHRRAARLASDARQAEHRTRPPTAFRRTSASTCG